MPAKKTATKKPASKRKEREPIVEIEGVEIAEAVEDKPAPNVIYAPSQEKEPATGKIRIGRVTIQLPTAEEQRAGFHSDHAALIRRNLRGYKQPTAKG